MFHFFRSKTPSVRLGELLQVDMHSHLLPGIDDGAPDTATSTDLARGLQELGYQKCITTPHTLPGLYDNTTESILEAYQQLPQDYPVTLQASSEYFMDLHLEEQISQKDLLAFGPENYVLTEMSFVSASRNYETVIFELKTQGYTPILAHPERYTYWQHKTEIFQHLQDMGCLMQINLLSLAGYYGKEVKRVALQLVEKGNVQFWGTDLHHAKHLHTLKSKEQDLIKIIKDIPVLNTSLI